MARAIARSEKIHRQIEAIRENDESDDSQNPVKSDEMAREASSADDPLLLGYIYQDRGLHIRRTLAQSYYPMLSDTKNRDRSQVLHRYPEPSRPKCVAMVDQLWLWMVDGRC